MIKKAMRFVSWNIVCVGLLGNEIRVGREHSGRHERHIKNWRIQKTMNVMREINFRTIKKVIKFVLLWYSM